MNADNKTQFQNANYGGLGYMHDPSWLKDHTPKPPKSVGSAGFQVNRWAKLAEYDIEKRRETIQRDKEDDPNIGIIDPFNVIYRVHEYNELPNHILPPDGDYAGINWDAPLQPEIPDVDAAGAGGGAGGGKKKTDDDEPKGRVRPWSKCWHFMNVIDGKHLVGSRLNRSTLMGRYVDYRVGAWHQYLDVRETMIPEGKFTTQEAEEYSAQVRGAKGATHTGEPPEEGSPAGGFSEAAPELPTQFQTAAPGNQLDPEFWPYDRIHHRLNVGFNTEGGYITNASPLNVGFHHDPPLAPAPRLFAQYGDAFVITPDDVYDYTGRDREGRSLLNLWHDVHFHMDPPHDGRIFFTRTPPGVEPFGLPYKGEMVGDPAVANTNTQWGQESVNWRPQIKRPQFYIVPSTPLEPTPTGVDGPVWYPPGWDFPVPVPTGGKVGYPMPKDGTTAIMVQGFAKDVNEIVVETVPLQFATTIGTDVSHGQLFPIPPPNAVIRYSVSLIKRNRDDLINPTYVDFGGIFVHQVAITGPHSTLHIGGTWDERMVDPGDMWAVTIWRDSDHPLDTFGETVYIYDSMIAVGPTTLEGECFNMVADDDTVATPDPLAPIFIP
jgi:hypothetical protein